MSQAVAGQEGTVFYITTLQSSLAGFDTIPTIQQTLGEEGYAKYLKTVADVVANAETVINRFLPELSNAPGDVVAAAPDYWTQKAVVAAGTKAKTAKGAVVNASSTEKMNDKDKQ